jgi:hypothetical protein
MYSYAFSICAALLCGLLAAAANPTDLSSHPYETSQHVLNLKRANAPLSPNVLRRDAIAKANPSNVIQVGPSPAYEVEVTVGTQSLLVIMDTGSTDFWVAGANFTCTDFYNYTTVAQSACSIPATYDASASSTFTEVDSSWNTSYAGDETMSGISGLETVTLAGVKVPQQIIGVANNITWLSGDNRSSGVLGLGFYASDDAINSDSIVTDASLVNATTKPLINSILAANLIPPLFSLALDRSPNTSAGLLALGGLPDIPYRAPFVTAPLRNTPDYDVVAPDAPASQRYSISAAGLTYTPPNTSTPVTNSTPYLGIIDSGTAGILLPSPVANAVNALFSPPATPAKRKDFIGLYSVSCEAAAPKFGIMIGNQTFYLNQQDMVTGPYDDGNCYTGIWNADTISPPLSAYVLGAAFLNNVIAVFDLGRGEMGFAARVEQEGTGSTKKGAGFAFGVSCFPRFHDTVFLTMIFVFNLLYIPL